jgi:branched-chain amino acid transport system substrate-binding protein
MYRGLLKGIFMVLIIAIVVAIGSFLAGMNFGSNIQGQTSPRAVYVTITIPQTIIVTQTVASVQTQPLPTPPTNIPDKIVIGAALELSGGYAEAARFGFYGLLAAIKWVNEIYGGVKLFGKKIPIEFKYYDSESSKDKAASLAERLIVLDKVDILFLPYASPIAAAVVPIGEKYKMIMIGWSTASDAIYEQGFKFPVMVLSKASDYLALVPEMMQKVDPSARRVAVLYADEEFSKYAGLGAIEKARSLGFNIVYAKSFPAAISDFTPYITELAAAKADILLVAGHGPHTQLLTKQLADYGVNFKFIAMTVGPCLPTFYQALGILSEGIACQSQWEPTVTYSPDMAKQLGIEWFGPTPQEFLRLYREVVKDPNALPSYHAGMAGGAILVTVKAIELAQSLDPVKIREAFNRLHIMTFFGEFKIDPQSGKQIAHKMVLGQWQNGKFVTIWPPDIAVSKPAYPIPTWDDKRAGKTASPS